MIQRIVFIVLITSLLSTSCKKDGFLGCDNVTAFEIDGEIFNATLFNNFITGWYDPYAGVEGLQFQIVCEDDAGNTFVLNILDFRNGSFGNCISTETYYANQGLNYCNLFPYVACNQFYASYYSANKGDFVSTGSIGQVDILNCDPSGQISGAFSFKMESLDSGNVVDVVSGSFNVCYQIL
ncbi:MAG: hypothetical protein ACI959_002095 [Limisphaerales bacterium]|jgi:hypothetical protein